MSKRILILFVAIGLATQLSGCTSRGSKDGGDVAVANDETFAEEGEADFAQGEKSADEPAESLDSTDESGELSEKVAKDDAPPADAGDDLAIDEDPGKAPSDELALDEPAPEVPPPADNKVATGDAPPADAASAAEPPPPSDEPLFTSEQPAAASEPPPSAQVAVEPPAPDSGLTEISPPSGEAAAPVAPPLNSFAPYLKVKDAPFTKGDTLLNRVYLARPGDTPKSIARKLYGSTSRSKDLVKWNPILNRGARTGDKIYYSSPKDPADSARMLTYFEENGIPPMIYSSLEGDNIRRVSKKLLGFGDAWKEVWATNPMIESKGDIPGGLEIRYWPEGAAVPPIAEAPKPTMEQLPPKESVAAPAGSGLAESTPPSEPPAMPAPDMPPPDLAQGQPPAPPAAGSMNEPPPEDPLAPPPTESAPPAPPKPTEPEEAVDPAMGTDSDTMMSMAFGAILLVAAVIVFAIVRRRQAKKAQKDLMDLGAQPGVGQDFGQTQI